MHIRQEYVIRAIAMLTPSTAIMANCSRARFKPSGLILRLFERLWHKQFQFLQRSNSTGTAQHPGVRTIGCPSCKILCTVMRALYVCTSSERMGWTRRPDQMEIDE